MNSILTLFLAVLYTVHALATGDDYHATNEHLRELGPFASIRKTTNDLSAVDRHHFDSNDSDAIAYVQCLARCAKQLTEIMKRDLPQTKNQTSIWLVEYSPENLNKFCSINDEARSCMDRCETGPLTTMVIKSTGIGRYMCYDSTFKQNSPCLNEVSDLIKATCDSQAKCGSYKQKVEQYKINRPTSESGLKDELKYTCQLLKCNLDCFKPTVISKCGQSAQNDLRGLADKYVFLLMYIVEIGGFGQTIPRECNVVTAA